MPIDRLIVAPSRLWGGESFADWPCVVIESCESPFPDARIMLPPCPLIAIGDSESAIARVADVIVADRTAAERIVGAVEARPRTAEVLIGLLRCLPAMPSEQGLLVESLAYGVLQAGAEHAGWLAAQTLPPVQPPGTVRGELQGDCLSIVLDRPWADNAIDRPMRDALADALQLAALDRGIGRVVLTGAGRSFSLGADLSEFGTTRDPAEAHYIRQRTLPARWAQACHGKLEVHVQGACVGAGLEIAAYAHRLTAGQRAWFQLPELAMGVLPGAGGCVSLVKRIGRQRTAELILTGQRLSARAALDWGLVDALVDDPPSDQGGADEA